MPAAVQDTCRCEKALTAVNFTGSCVDQDPAKHKSQGSHAILMVSAYRNAKRQAQSLHVRHLAAYPSTPLPYPSLGAITHQVLRQIKYFLLQ